MPHVPIPQGDPEVERLVSGLEDRWQQSTRAEGLRLNRNPDGFGFYYGTYTTGDRRLFMVNILPPRHAWAGDFIMPNLQPDDRNWIVYVEGDEIGRIAHIDDIGGLFDARHTTALSQLADTRALRHQCKAALASGSLWRKGVVALKVWWHTRASAKGR